MRIRRRSLKVLQCLVFAADLRALPSGTTSHTFGPSARAPAGSRYEGSDLGEQLSAFSFAGGGTCTATATLSDGTTATGTISSPTSTFPMKLAGGSLFKPAPCDGRTLSLTLTTAGAYAPATCAGTVPLSGLTYGGGGSLDDKGVIVNSGVYEFDAFFHAAADPDALATQFNAYMDSTDAVPITNYVRASVVSGFFVITAVDNATSFTLSAAAGGHDGTSILGLANATFASITGSPPDLYTVVGDDAQIGAALFYS